MSEKTKDIREMVIPLERCPRLYDHQTLDEAIALFGQSPSEENPLDLHFLLVLDQRNNLVGRLSRTDILRGLVPSLLGMGRGGSKFSWGNAEDPHLTCLYEDHALAECGGNRARLVRSLMRPVDFTLSADTHILEAIVVLHRHNTSCVPVIDNGAVIGLLRFEELFHAMCNTWCTSPQD
ncbi:CBS domain-containing protein [Candidatus Electrothrix marina]|uniref:CBS domain-containing protein n=1 Tax=Candidatus Electrothrix marina TaxID=1859130 RepID=A0A3S3QMP9_9BACT|nr:CBS domain-containing protein [Candidatus Electrothrix marina]RWX52181.1 CBS domain-containing protein [Candidatus Electrothrix marina]